MHKNRSFYQARDPDDAIRIYFENDSEPYSVIKNRMIRNVLAGQIPAWNGLKVLEIGAAGGRWTGFFLAKQAAVTCVDISEQVLKGNERLHPQARFILGDGTSVHAGEGFGLVFAKDVIEHIPDDAAFLANMNRHLADNGLLLLNTQNSVCLNYLVQGGYHFLKGNRSWKGWDPTHLRFYTVMSLKKKLRAAGFIPLKWFGSYFFPYRLLADHFGRWVRPGVFCLAENISLYDKFPFSVTGWNIGVIARKQKNFDTKYNETKV